MNGSKNNNETAAFGNTLLCEVAYEKCQLVAKKEQVYTADGKYMFSVSMTDRAKALLDNDGWEKGKESWLDYRQRTKAERELEKQKQYKLAADLADAFNRMHGNFAQRIANKRSNINININMKTNLNLLWYWLETRYAKLLRLFGVVRSTDCIPDGMYCYEYDEERNTKEATDGYWIKPCKYYRSTPKTGGVACTYVGYMGFDPCLYDQCKICGVKDSFENED